METLVKIILTPILFVGSLLGLYNPNAGATLPQGAAVFQTSLQSPITSSATSMTLTANSVRGGGTLSGYNCFTIDEGSAQAEYVCGTVSGTTVSSLVRGVDPLTATSTNATLQFPHRRGASVKITDFPLLQIMRNQLNGTDNIPGILFYTQNNTFSSSTQLVSKGYVDGVAVAGASNSDESTKGIVELATTAEAAAGTSLGGTSARLVIPSSMCSATASANVLCVITSAAGKIAQGFFDLTETFTWTGKHSFNANASTTGLSAGYAYFGTTATSSFSNTGVLSLATTTSGILKTSTTGVVFASKGETAKFIGQTGAVSVTDTTTAASSTAINIPAGMLGVDGSVQLTFRFGASDTAVNTNSDGFIRFSLGGTSYCEFTLTDIANAGNGNGEFYLFANGNSSVYMYGKGVTPGSTGSGNPQSVTCETTVSTSTVTDNLTLRVTVKLNDEHVSDTESISVGNIYAIFMGRQN